MNAKEFYLMINKKKMWINKLRKFIKKTKTIFAEKDLENYSEKKIKRFLLNKNLQKNG